VLGAPPEGSQMSCSSADGLSEEAMVDDGKETNAQEMEKYDSQNERVLVVWGGVSMYSQPHRSSGSSTHLG